MNNTTLMLMVLLAIVFAVIPLILPERTTYKRRKLRNEEAINQAMVEQTEKTKREIARERKLRVKKERMEAADMTTQKKITWILVGGFLGAFTIFSLTSNIVLALLFSTLGWIFNNLYINRKVIEQRNLLTEQAIFSAQSAVGSLKAGLNLSTTITRLGSERTKPPIKNVFERINAARTRGASLYEAIDSEMRVTDNIVLWRLLKIFKEGADQKASLDDALILKRVESFYVNNMRMARIIQEARTATSAAKGTRTMMLFLIPMGVAANVFMTGGETFNILFRTVAGNILLVAILGLMLAAFFLTERMLVIKVE